MLVRLEDGRELRLREFGTKQRAWAKLLPSDAVNDDEAVARLGPEAWPPPPLDEFAALIDQPRHLHPLLRHQGDISGIGRSWVDEILWEARLSPFKKGSELDDAEVKQLHAALHVLGDAIEHYEETIGEQLPDKVPMPLQVHKREGEPCPRCGTTIEAVFFSEHQTNYCPKEQTGGRVLKDRRLSQTAEVESRGRRASSSSLRQLDQHAEVERRSRVGQGADGDQVYAGFGDATHGLQVDAAGSLQRGAFARAGVFVAQPHRAAQGLEVHVVEQEDVGAGA